jgi:type I restriction enzyme M protein
VSPRDAKRDERLRNSGALKCFDYDGQEWETEPKSMFYDWLYCKAVSLDQSLSDNIMKYDAFTDIEFNPKKSINCQARAAAIFVSLKQKDLLGQSIDDKEQFRTIYGMVQTSLKL